MDERLLYGVAVLAFSSTYFPHGVLEESSGWQIAADFGGLFL
jgi:hypothetical protein